MKPKRSTSIVSKKLQYQILISLMASGISIYLISALGLRFLASNIIEILEITEIKSEAAMHIIEEVNQSSTYLLGFSSLALFLTWLSALYLSNRIAGPIFNMDRVLDQRLAGDKEARIKTRKNDFFKHVIDKMNELMERKEI